MPTRDSILVADDDADFLVLLAESVERLRPYVRVLQAGSGQAALDILRRWREQNDVPRPSLVCLDVEMPGVGGLDVLASIKADPDLAEMPVVLMTGRDHDDARLLAARAGADGFAHKGAEVLDTAKTILAAHEWFGHDRLPVASWPTPVGAQEGDEQP